MAEGVSSSTVSYRGSTGNVYTIVIQHLPTCDCPDYGKGNHCKHLLFVMLKVSRLGRHFVKAC